MGNFICCVKGVSGSGKSTRTFLLIKFLREKLGFTDEPLFYTDDSGKRSKCGILFPELNLLVFGKEYNNNGFIRFQGLDSVTSVFGSNAKISEFLKNSSKQYSIILEGAGTTQSNRFRPKMLFEDAGYERIMLQYYNYPETEEGKKEYMDRIIYRNGKKPNGTTMWEKNPSYTKEVSVSEQELSDLNSAGHNPEVYIFGDIWNEKPYDLGLKILTLMMDFPDEAENFVEFVINSNYINDNSFEYYNALEGNAKPVEKKVVEKKIEKPVEAVISPVESKAEIISFEPLKGSIFPVHSLSRNDIRWEDYLYQLTPVQKMGDMWFKREDFFAPLGYGGINGSKLRQAIWLVNEYHKTGNTIGLISGASVKSPQLPMSTAVASHFGIKSEHVVGATRPETSIKKDMVSMATWFGAEFNFLKVGYNPVLQSKVKSLLENECKGYYYLNYGITVPETDPIDKIIEFHQLGANQVRNIPDHIETMIIPAGSGNSAISILLGLSHYRPKNLKTVIMLGIGPSKLDFIFKRLNKIRNKIGVNTVNYLKGFEDNVELIPEENALELFYLDIHSIPKYDYQNEVKKSYGGIDFHPTYEGKMIDYMQLYLPDFMNDKTLFWIVGSKPDIKNMMFLQGTLGGVPDKVKVKFNQWNQ